MSDFKLPKIGIYINTLTGGGRRIVVDRIIYILNGMGIIPDLITFRVNKSYQKGTLQYNLIQIPTRIPGRPKLLYEYKVIALNKRVRPLSLKYDLLINSNNSILQAPDVPTIVYMHFPRNGRYTHNFEKYLEQREKGVSYYLTKLFMRMVHPTRLQVPENYYILANSNYTKSVFLESHSIKDDERIDVLYPPVHFEIKNHSTTKEKSVVSLGRFSSTKKQLEQIKVARKCKDLTFHLIGFVGDRESKNYFAKCQDYISRYDLQNVFLHPNINEEQKNEIMQSATYFIHSLHNEPFGISTVEAIAHGCIPIVPNSGGQKEIVPFEELRYEKIEEIAEIIMKLERSKFDFQELKNQIKDYSLSAFDSAFTKVLKRHFND